MVGFLRYGAACQTRNPTHFQNSFRLYDEKLCMMVVDTVVMDTARTDRVALPEGRVLTRKLNLMA